LANVVSLQPSDNVYNIAPFFFTKASGKSLLLWKNPHCPSWNITPLHQAITSTHFVLHISNVV